MKYLMAIGVLSACASPAQNTGAVDPVIESCISEGLSHQVCACTAINLRAEIGKASYDELLPVLARMVALKAQGLDTPLTDPQAGLGEYQYLSGVRDRLTQRGNRLGLAYRANRELCMAEIQN